MKITKRKVLNISEEVYNTLKTYCEQKGLVMFKFVEQKIMDFISKDRNTNMLEKRELLIGTKEDLIDYVLKRIGDKPDKCFLMDENEKNVEFKIETLEKQLNYIKQSNMFKMGQIICAKHVSTLNEEGKLPEITVEFIIINVKIIDLYSK